VAQFVAIKKTQASWGELQRGRHHRRPWPARMQCVIQPARRIVHERRQMIDHMTADAAALLVARQIVAIDCLSDLVNRTEQLRRGIGGSEILHMQE